MAWFLWWPAWLCSPKAPHLNKLRPAKEEWRIEDSRFMFTMDVNHILLNKNTNVEGFFFFLKQQN